MEENLYVSSTELEAGLEHILQSPKDAGVLQHIVRRPHEDEREIVAEAVLDPVEGLVGDSWKTRTSGAPNHDRQLTLMNARVVALVAGPKDRWGLAGDQLFVALDLSAATLPCRTPAATNSSRASDAKRWCLSTARPTGTCTCAASMRALSSQAPLKSVIRPENCDIYLK